MNALFFVEGGPGVGLGHLRRCFALAHALSRRGWTCEFLAGSKDAQSWLTSRSLALRPSRPGSGRLPATDYSCDVFVLDSYVVPSSEAREKARPKAGLILAFDDLLNRHDVADVILSTGVVAPELPWPGRDKARHLLGPAYHPLSPEFLPLVSRREIKPSVERVLLTMGGAAQSGAFERLLPLIAKAFPDAGVDCVVGPFTKPSASLSGKNVRLVQSPDSLKPLMLSCDLAVAASGQTLFELAATGTPTIAVGLVDNQKENLVGMDRAGSVLSAGAIGEPGFDARLAACLEKARSAKAREALSKAGRTLVDGEGGPRVEKVLSGMLAERRASR